MSRLRYVTDRLGRLSPSAFGAAALALWVLGVFSCFTALFFPHWLFHLDSALIGPWGDNLQDYWNTWYGVTQASGHFFHTDLIRYPTGTPLYYNSFDYPQIAAVALLSRIAGTAPAALLALHNITLLASFPLAGAGAFFLTRHFTKDILGASLGGFVFAFSPWHVQQAMHHAHVSSIEFIPMFVLAYLLALERQSIAWLCAAIVFYALSALSCWYYLVYIGFFLVFHFLYTARSEGSLRWKVGAPLACAVGVLAILSPLIVPMAIEALHGAPVYTDPLDSKVFVADLGAYIAFPPTHLLARLGWPVYRQLTGNPWEATVYLGLVNLAIAVWACFRSGPRERSVFFYLLAGMATFAVLASGDELHVLGSRLVVMPGALYSHLPFFANVRTPSRAIVFVYLFLGVAVGLATRMAFDRYGQTIARIGLSCVLLLMLVDFYPTHLDGTPAVCEPGWASIRNDASGRYGVLMLPRGLMRPVDTQEDVSGYAEQVVYMYQQAACHGRPIVQGTPSRDVVTGLLEALNMRDLGAQKEQLVEARVKYIVVDRAVPWSRRDGAQAQYSQMYPTVYDGADLTILRVY